jgi:hypothetical protein
MIATSQSWSQKVPKGQSVEMLQGERLRLDVLNRYSNRIRGREATG